MRDDAAIVSLWPSFAVARDAVVLEVGGLAYRWRDVEALARHRGRWAPFQRRVLCNLAAADAAQRTGSVVSEAEVSARAASFRRAHGLFAAEDAERWLAARRLAVGDWLDWIRHELLAERADHHALADDQQGLDAALWVHGVCGGWLRRFSDDLAGHAAVLHRVAERHGGSVPTEPPGPGELTDTYRRFLERGLTDDRVARVLADHHLDWTWVEAVALDLPTEGAAREAAALLREGEHPEAVARLAAVEVATVAERVTDLPEALRPHLTSAPPRSVVGPVRIGDGWTVLHVRRRRGPSRGAPADVRLARRELERRLVGREIDRSVRWRDRV